MAENDPAPDEPPPDASLRTGTARFAKVGIGLILLSGVFFLALFIIPLLPASAGTRLLLAGASYACMQIAWWVGAALAGPETVRRIRSAIRRAVSRKKAPP